METKLAKSTHGAATTAGHPHPGTIGTHRLLDAPQVADIVGPALPADERQWIPLNEGVWFHPLQLDITRGAWTNLLKVVPNGRLACHAHPNPVHAYTLQGSWGYLEHDWTATAGDFVYETPGEAHTLVAYEDREPMRVFFTVKGPLIWLDDKGEPCGYFDVHNYIDLCKAHYESVGLGAGLIEKLYR